MKKRILSILLAFLMVAALLPATAFAASGLLVNVKITGTENYSDAYAILDSLNAHRAANGQAALTMDRELMETAMLRAAEIALYYSHTRPNGERCNTAFPPKNGGWGENIAIGYSSYSAVMDGWKNSQGHNENMLRSTFRSVGIGTFTDNNGRHYWVQAFSSVTATPENSRSSGTRAVTRTIQADSANLAIGTNALSNPVSLTPGGSIQVQATNANQGSYSGSYSQPNVGYTYAKSSDPDVVSVSLTSAGQLTITGVKSGGATVTVGFAAVSGNGKYSADIPVVVSGSDPSTQPGWINPFRDVKSSDWFYSSVEYAASHGLMAGVSANNFDPYGTTTRGMIMTILARRAGVDTSNSSPWYQAGMRWAMTAGISDGTNPQKTITREEFVTMLWRDAGEPASSYRLTGYGDISQIHDWANGAMAWAVEKGIVQGSGGKLNPRATATRCEAATMLTRFCEL